MTRRGFTLVEMIVTVTIALFVMSAALGVWMLAYRSQGATSAFHALQAALLVEERLQDDLDRLMSVHASPVRYWPKDPARLAFYVVDPSARTGDKLGLRGVEYSHERAGAFLMRSCDGRRAPLGGLPLTSIVFTPFSTPDGSMVRVALEVAPPLDGPAGPPVVHSFLTRLPSLHRRPGVPFEILSGFSAPDSAPGDQRPPFP